MSKQTFYATTLGFNLPLSKWLKASKQLTEITNVISREKRKKKIQKYKKLVLIIDCFIYEERKRRGVSLNQE
jgi:hypothetical protein